MYSYFLPFSAVAIIWLSSTALYHRLVNAVRPGEAKWLRARMRLRAEILASVTIVSAVLSLLSSYDTLDAKLFSWGSPTSRIESDANRIFKVVESRCAVAGSNCIALTGAAKALTIAVKSDRDRGVWAHQSTGFFVDAFSNYSQQFSEAEQREIQAQIADLHRALGPGPITDLVRMVLFTIVVYSVAHAIAYKIATARYDYNEAEAPEYSFAFEGEDIDLANAVRCLTELCSKGEATVVGKIGATSKIRVLISRTESDTIRQLRNNLSSCDIEVYRLPSVGQLWRKYIFEKNASRKNREVSNSVS